MKNLNLFFSSLIIMLLCVFSMAASAESYDFKKIGQNSGFDGKRIYGVFVDSGGAVLVGAGDDGLFIGKKDSDGNYLFEKSELGGQGKAVYRVFGGVNGVVYAETSGDNDLLSIGTKDSRGIYRFKNLGLLATDLEKAVRSFYVDVNGVVYVGTEFGGVWIAEKERGGSYKKFKRLGLDTSPGCKSLGDKDWVDRVYVDARGVVYLTEPAGGYDLLFIGKKDSKTGNYCFKNPKSGLEKESIISIYTDAKGIIYAGTSSDNMGKFTGALFIGEKDDSDDVYKFHNAGLSGKFVFSAYLDTAGVVYVGTADQDGGLFIGKKEGNGYNFFKPSPGLNGSVSILYGDESGQIYAVEEIFGADFYPHDSLFRIEKKN